MERVEQHILGSAEPLTPVQREARLRELAEWGVDLNLSYAQLHKTPDERLDDWLAMYAFAQEAARARAAGRIYPRCAGRHHTSSDAKTVDGASWRRLSPEPVKEDASRPMISSPDTTIERAPKRSSC